MEQSITYSISCTDGYPSTGDTSDGFWDVCAQDLQDLHCLEAHVEMMYLTLFLCNNQLATRGLVIAMMMTMTLDLALATLVQDLTMTALVHMIVVIMIVDPRLDAIILQTALDLLHDFIISLLQVLVHLEWYQFKFFQRTTHLNSRVTIQVNIQVNIQANIQANTQAIIPFIFAALGHLLLLMGILLEL